MRVASAVAHGHCKGTGTAADAIVAAHARERMQTLKGVVDGLDW